MRQSRRFPGRLLDAMETAEVRSLERKAMMLRVSELNATMAANQDISTAKGVLLPLN